jgi:DNA gyrase subunit A
MITTQSGVVIRTAANELRVMGRATQGVKIIRLDEDDQIADVTVVASAEDEVINGEGEAITPIENGEVTETTTSEE